MQNHSPGSGRFDPFLRALFGLENLYGASLLAEDYFSWEEWAFLWAACARLIPTDENGPGAVELGVPEFIDREMDGGFGQADKMVHAGTVRLRAARTRLSITAHAARGLPDRYRRGRQALPATLIGNKSFSELPAATQDSVLTDLENGTLDFENVSGTGLLWLSVAEYQGGLSGRSDSWR